MAYTAFAAATKTGTRRSRGPGALIRDETPAQQQTRRDHENKEQAAAFARVAKELKG